MGPLAILGLSAGASLVGNLVNNLMGRSNAQYAYDNFNSPAAQVRGFRDAGMNPAVGMSQSGGQSGANQAAPPTPSENPFGMVNLEQYANSLKALADAKKAGVDTRSAEEDIKLKQIEQDAKDFELRLQKYFGTKERAQALALLEKNVRIAQLTGDTKEQEKAINEWLKAKEKAISEAEENKRDILKKELENTDKRLKLENRVLSTQGTSNLAAANASNAAAGLAKAQTKTEDATRDYKAFALDLANHMQGLEYGFNIDTYQQRLEKFAHEVGITKWTEFMQSVEAKDRAAYNAVQRIIMGKGTKEDGKTFWNLVNDGRQLIPFK